MYQGEALNIPTAFFFIYEVVFAFKKWMNFSKNPPHAIQNTKKIHFAHSKIGSQAYNPEFLKIFFLALLTEPQNCITSVQFNPF